MNTSHPTPSFSVPKNTRTQPVLRKRVGWSGVVAHEIDEDFDEGAELYVACIFGRRERS